MTELLLAGRTYRVVDVATKVAGVGLLAGGFELGIGSAPGVALALAGAAIGVSTVFVTEQTP
ncbi:MAG: hypothetical protein ABEJ76_08565 [Halanaeroarchaeum sp.]